MPSSSSRLTRLERLHGASGGIVSLIIQRQIFWREGDVLRSVPAYASILNGSSCERVAYSKDETEAAFDARVNAKACGGK
jgi:hypothetical protein